MFGRKPLPSYTFLILLVFHVGIFKFVTQFRGFFNPYVCATSKHWFLVWVYVLLGNIITSYTHYITKLVLVELSPKGKMKKNVIHITEVTLCWL